MQSLPILSSFYCKHVHVSLFSKHFQWHTSAIFTRLYSEAAQLAVSGHGGDRPPLPLLPQASIALQTTVAIWVTGVTSKLPRYAEPSVHFGHTLPEDVNP
jgi:hypothetical protein